MFFKKKYSCLSDEVVNKINLIYKNREQAYNYYADVFEKDYPKQSVKGKVLYFYTNTTYALEQAEYMFYSFDTVDIGSPVALNEADYVVVEGIQINYCDFQNCNIKNIIFRNCTFSGTNFSDIHFDHVIFDSCIFSVPVMESGRVGTDNIYYAPTVFQTCTFVGTFINCDIEHCLFEKVSFTLSKFEKCSLYASVLNMCDLSSVDIKDCNMSSFGIINTDILELSFSDERKSIVDENTFIDFKVRSKKEKDKTEIMTSSGWKSNCFDDMCLNKAKSIKAISRIFEVNNLSDLSGEYFYQSKLVERKALHKLPKLVSTVELASCGYGERPLFTMITIIVITFLFAVIYMFTGINADGLSIKYTIIGGYPVGFIKAITDYGQCLYFSIITGTIGYGNYDPVGMLSKIISSLQMVLGIGLFALWTGCIFRKITR